MLKMTTHQVRIISILVCIVIRLGIVRGFAIFSKLTKHTPTQYAFCSHHDCRHYYNPLSVSTQPTARKTTSTALFVRNIDLPEAVLFYGKDSFLQYDSDNKNDHGKKTPRFSFKPGLDKFFADCVSRSKVSDSMTAIVFLLDNNNNRNHQDNQDDIALLHQQLHQKYKYNHFYFYNMTVPPPNPRDLYDCINNNNNNNNSINITIQPDSFGGSSGFGKRTWQEPPRCPLPSRCVAVTTTTYQSLAAAYMGMRIIRWKKQQQTHDNNDDNDMVADVVFPNHEWEAEWLEDIATPGSYWLNPPHPRDQHGNRIDSIQAVIDYYSSNDDDDSCRDVSLWQPSFTFSSEMMSDDDDDDRISDEELERLLADLAPLKNTKDRPEG